MAQAPKKKLPKARGEKRAGYGKSRMSQELGVKKKHRKAVAGESVSEGVRLENVRVVLVGTAGAANIGQCCRAMLNMGLTRLYLVNPCKGWRSSQSRQMAVGAAWELLKNATVCESLAEALEGTRYSVAFAEGKGRQRSHIKNYEDLLPHVAEVSQGADVALVFGNEANGLSNDELHTCHEAARLLVNPSYGSLNLAQAVLVAAAQVYTYNREPAPIERPFEYATHDQLEGFYGQLWRILERTHFMPKQNPMSLFEQIRAMYGRIPLEAREVNLLRGILSHFEWNLDNPGKASPRKKPEKK